MTTLYDITAEYAHALATLEDMDDISQEVIEDSLAVLKDDLNTKAVQVGHFLKNLKANADAIRSEEKKLAERRKSLVSKYEDFKFYLLKNMQAAGINKIEHPTIELKLRKAPVSVDITDESQLPDEFCTIVRTPNKIAIKSYIAEKGFIEGARLIEDKQTLSIK